MTVAELIAELQKMPQGREVKKDVEGHWYSIDVVVLDADSVWNPTTRACDAVPIVRLW